MKAKATSNERADPTESTSDPATNIEGLAEEGHFTDPYILEEGSQVDVMGAEEKKKEPGEVEEEMEDHVEKRIIASEDSAPNAIDVVESDSDSES